MHLTIPPTFLYAPEAGDGGGGTGATGAATGASESTGTTTTTTAADDGLGDAGKKAITEERKARATAERDAKAARDELDQLKKTYQTDQEKALDAAKTEGRNEALSTANQRIVRAEVKAVASGKTIDPDAVVALLDLSQFKVDDNGDVDAKAISSAIDELLKEKPYLTGKAKAADLKQGARGATSEIDPDQFIRDMARR